ncbi:MAG: hypothetical protein HY607_02315 [Planctomycetes bacterium]|nr:hypothetical protein [Planctomycetota bacterium]MBI4221504.1 hypothetical protein [Planctomycetota bacterium]
MAWTYTMRLKTKQSCVDCHFFMRKNGQSLENLGEIEAEERDQARQGDYSWIEFKDNNILACSFGVWDKQDNNKFDQKEYHQLIAETNRRGFCFWWKYHPGMLFPAAKILQEREAKNRDAARDRRLTLYGLWIAAIALVINAWLTLAQKLKLWPFN